MGLASYYTERGETPGVWIGSGLGGIDGLAAGDPVTAEQMRALFGCSLHPLAELRQQQLEGLDLSLRDFQEVTRLGVPFKIWWLDAPVWVSTGIYLAMGYMSLLAAAPLVAAVPPASSRLFHTAVANCG